MQKEIARHFSVTWRAARWDPGAFFRGLPPVLLLPLQPAFPALLLVLLQRILPQVEKADEKVAGEQLL